MTHSLLLRGHEDAALLRPTALQLAIRGSPCTVTRPEFVATRAPQKAQIRYQKLSTTISSLLRNLQRRAAPHQHCDATPTGYLLAPSMAEAPVSLSMYCISGPQPAMTPMSAPREINLPERFRQVLPAQQPLGCGHSRQYDSCQSLVDQRDGVTTPSGELGACSDPECHLFRQLGERISFGGAECYIIIYRSYPS